MVQYLPTIDAILNCISTIFLILGFIEIKKGNKETHKKYMISALISSALFLACYLVYHYYTGSKKFPDLGWIKILYFVILFPHIVLAALMVPMILMTFYHAFKGNFEKHMWWAKKTFPIWLYVSITGVIIYLMLYVFFT